MSDSDGLADRVERLEHSVRYLQRVCGGLVGAVAFLAPGYLGPRIFGPLSMEPLQGLAVAVVVVVVCYVVARAATARR